MGSADVLAVVESLESNNNSVNRPVRPTGGYGEPLSQRDVDETYGEDASIMAENADALFDGVRVLADGQAL